MKKLYICENAEDCPNKGCSHRITHRLGEHCYDDCDRKGNPICIPTISAHVEYQINRLANYPEDDPHYGTEYQGMYAGLTIEKNGKKYFFRCANFQYDKDVVDILSELVK